MNLHEANLHEVRIHAMLDPKSQADWNLNDEDRAAIRWLLSYCHELRDDRHRIQRQHNDNLKQNTEQRQKIADLIREMVEVIR